jgi:serine/threonine protein phosphatase PrpC
MGATLSLGWLTPEWLYFAHIGDSRIYVLPQAGGIRRSPTTTAYVGWLRRKAESTNARPARTPDATPSTRPSAPGNQFIDPHIGAVDHSPGDRFLMCSDGLIDGLWDRHLDEILHQPDPAPAAQRLLAAALERAARDNITAMVVEVLAPTP